MKAEIGKKAAILPAAQALLLKFGVRGTSMEAIARQAGIAKPTLYAHFADKRAVLNGLADALCALWRSDFLGALAGEGDVVERIGLALTAKHKAVARRIGTSPHGGEIYGADGQQGVIQFAALEAEIETLISIELATAGVMRARPIAQLVIAGTDGIARKAKNITELGPAIRLMTERLVRPELEIK